MTLDWFILAASALGHFCLLVWLWNISHGIGLSERETDHVIVGLGVAWLATSAVLAWPVWGLAWSQWPPAVKGYSALCLVVALGIVPLSTLALHLRGRRPVRSGGRRGSTSAARRPTTRWSARADTNGC